jgi:hypothetical protein
LPTGLTNLTKLYLNDNQLKNFSFLSGLRDLTRLDLLRNGLTNLMIPAELTNLAVLNVASNQLATLVLPETLATGRLAATIKSLRSKGVNVYTYPLAVNLVSPQWESSASFRLSLVGPPAIYGIRGSTDMSVWNQLGTLTNTLGAATYTDVDATNSSQRFYLAVPEPQ